MKGKARKRLNAFSFHERVPMWNKEGCGDTKHRIGRKEGRKEGLLVVLIPAWMSPQHFLLFSLHFFVLRCNDRKKVKEFLR